jgi:hypothetical protein
MPSTTLDRDQTIQRRSLTLMKGKSYGPLFFFFIAMFYNNQRLLFSKLRAPFAENEHVQLYAD